MCDQRERITGLDRSVWIQILPVTSSISFFKIPSFDVFQAVHTWYSMWNKWNTHTGGIIQDVEKWSWSSPPSALSLLISVRYFLLLGSLLGLSKLVFLSVIQGWCPTLWRTEHNLCRRFSLNGSCLRNLKEWYKATYLQNRNRLTDIENKFMITPRENRLPWCHRQ